MSSMSIISLVLWALFDYKKAEYFIETPWFYNVYCPLFATITTSIQFITNVLMMMIFINVIRVFQLKAPINYNKLWLLFPGILFLILLIAIWGFKLFNINYGMPPTFCIITSPMDRFPESKSQILNIISKIFQWVYYYIEGFIELIILVWGCFIVNKFF